MSINSKMTSIADRIRSLMGLDATMGLDAMADNLGDATATVENQDSLIQQCISELKSKIAGSGVKITKVASDFVCERTVKTINITSFEGWESVTADNIFYVTKSVKSTASGTFSSGAACDVTMTYSNGVISLNRAGLSGSLVLTFVMDVYIAV